MSAFDPVLAAVDFSDDARRAATRATLVAAEQGARLGLLHVLSNASASSLRDLLRPHSGVQAQVQTGVRAMLEDLAADLAARTGVAATGRVEQGEVLPVILAAARQARRDALSEMISTVASIGGDRSRLSHAVAHGHPPQVILAKARQLRADLVVIGKRGRAALEDFLIGSVTRHVLSDSQCDVLVVQERAGRA